MIMMIDVGCPTFCKVDMDAVKQNIANIKKELAEVEAKMEKQLEELGL